MNEIEIIKKCIKKDPKSQKQIFEKYYNSMYHLAMRFLANHHDVEDILIISFSRVFDKIGNFEYKFENSLNKWIKTIVINESIRFLNHRKELQLVEDLIFIENEVIPEENISLDTEEAYSIIENMPAGYRTVFNLYAIEGYSHQEISQMLNITQSTSKSQLCKARNFIINKLNNNTIYGIPKFG